MRINDLVRALSSLGQIEFGLRQVTCPDCGSTWCPFIERLGLRPRQRVLEELLRRLVDWVTELSYDKTTRIGGEWLGATVSPRTLHPEVQRRGESLEFTEASPLFVERLDAYSRAQGLLERAEPFVLHTPPSAECTTSVMEREMREINRRTDVGARWSVPGITNLSKLRLAKRHNQDDYERVWSPLHNPAHIAVSTC